MSPAMRRLLPVAGWPPCHRTSSPSGSPLPDGFPPLGSFEVWSRTVCGAPGSTFRIRVRPWPPTGFRSQAQPPRPAPNGHGQGRFRLPQSSNRPHDPRHRQEHGSRGALRAAVDQITVKARDDRSAVIALGKWLDGERGRVVGGIRLESTRDSIRVCFASDHGAQRCALERLGQVVEEKQWAPRVGRRRSLVDVKGRSTANRVAIRAESMPGPSSATDQVSLSICARVTLAAWSRPLSASFL